MMNVNEINAKMLENVTGGYHTAGAAYAGAKYRIAEEEERKGLYANAGEYGGASEKFE